MKDQESHLFFVKLQCLIENGNEERNARIVMTYFYRLTLQNDVGNFEVPHVSKVRKQEETWQRLD